MFILRHSLDLTHFPVYDKAIQSHREREREKGRGNGEIKTYDWLMLHGVIAAIKTTLFVVSQAPVCGFMTSASTENDSYDMKFL